MLNEAMTKLGAEQLAHFEKQGFYFPVRIFEEAEAAELGVSLPQLFLRELGSG